MSELLTTSWIVPIARPPIRNGWVRVEEDRILALGAHDPSIRARDLGPGVLLPGLVNAHCHLELSHLEGRLEGGNFVPWIESLVATRALSGEDEALEATGRAIDGMWRSGTVAVGDISNGLAHLDLLRSSPLDGVVFLEVLGWDPSRAEEVATSARERLRAIPPGRPEVRLGAHAPHSVSEALLRLLGRDIVAIHLAESPSEVHFLRTGEGDWGGFLERRGLRVAFDPPGLSPVAYLAGLGVLHDRLLAAHCAQAEVGDIDLLASASCSVVVCPRSNRFLGLRVPPVPAMLKAGVRVCLGTDSLASAPSLDVWDDLLALHDAFPGIPWQTLVTMATRSGAQALGLEDLGSLEPGMQARFAFVPLSSPPEDPWTGLSLGRPRSLPS